MTICILGKITMQGATCEKCGALIQPYAYSDTIKCYACGSVYLFSASEPKNDGSSGIEFQFDFKEFRCLHTTYAAECHNSCPAMDMYCKEHTSDASFEDVKRSIQYAQERVNEISAKLSKMEESKRIWLIEEISGVK
jgi:hypothetical protein